MHGLLRLLSVASVLMLLALVPSLFWSPSAQASCGSASCFLNVGNQPASQPKGLVRVDLSYSYAPQTSPENRVAAVNLKDQRQILGEHQEFQTLNQRLQLDLNYGVTDNLTLQVTVPLAFRDHDHRIEVGEEPAGTGEGEFENFDAIGLGDVRVMAKYGVLPSLRSLVVFGVGVDFPTGDFEARNSEGDLQEPTLQIGRGDYGVVGQVYQAYEILPHRLNQFLSYTYEHTFENKFQYRFGDRHTVSAGLIYQVTPNLALSGQVNWRYAVHDTFASNLEQAGPVGASADPTVLDPRVLDRPVANTGSTTLLLTPGLTLNLGSNTSWYFYGQAPLARDANGGLEQGVSFLTGFVKFFSLDTGA